jgi:hypothetical protein
MGALGQLRRMDRRRIVHGPNAKGLETLRPAQHLADDARSFVGRLEPVAAQARHMQENVGKVFVRNDESITL